MLNPYALAEIMALNRPEEMLDYPWEVKYKINRDVLTSKDNVVFPTGAVVRDKRLYIYYGAGDTVIAARSVDLAELLTELKKSSLKL